MSAVIRVAHTIHTGPPEAAGGSMFLLNGSELLLAGLGVPFLKEMFVVLNISVSSTYGYYLEASTMVINKSSDLGSLPISHDADWTKAGIGASLVYSHPITWESSNIYFREPPLLDYKTAIFQPFLPDLWLAYVMLSFVIALLLLSLVQWGNATSKLKSNKKFTFLRLCIEALEQCIAKSHLSHVQLQLPKITENLARNIRISMEFCSTYLMAIYTAKIVSVLILKEHRIKSPEDLVTHGYTISSYDDIHIDRVFGNSKTREIVQRTFQYVKEYETIEKVLGINIEDPRQAMISHPDGFYPNAEYGLHYNQQLCLVTSFEGVRKTPRCLYIRKDSPFREKVNLGITLMRERGFSQRLNIAWQKRHIFKCTTKQVTVNPISFDHVVFIVYGLIAGSILGIMVHLC